MGNTAVSSAPDALPDPFYDAEQRLYTRADDYLKTVHGRVTDEVLEEVGRMVREGLAEELQ